jgi:hypothetical protein
MTFTIPSYIPIDKIANMPIEHHWDDYDPYILFPELNEDTMLFLSKMTERAKYAFAIGCAEWVVYRFQKFSDDPRPLQFLESCWAVEMSEMFESPDESEDEEWEGPVRGPIDLALMTVLNTFYGTDDRNSEEDAAFAELIPLHVLPNAEDFISWRDRILPSLIASYPYNEKDILGMPVPREALDPSLPLNMDQRTKLVNDYLSNLPIDGNPFLMRVNDDNLEESEP